MTMTTLILGGLLTAGIGAFVMFMLATKGDSDIYIESAESLRDIRTGRTN